MKETSAGINKTIRKLNYEKDMLLIQEEQGSFYVYAEGEKKVIPEYNFDAVQQRIEDIDNEVMHLRHVLNVFNSSYVLMDGMTIDQGVIKMAQLENRRRQLERMAKASPRLRIKAKRNKYTEYKCTNYDVAKARQKLNSVLADIERIQLLLDRVSNTVLIDIVDTVKDVGGAAV